MKIKSQIVAFKETFLQAVETLKGKKVAVMGHQRPDGDSFGSQIALVRCLRELGVDAVGLSEDPLPGRISCFTGDTPYYFTKDFDHSGYGIVTVDSAEITRIGELGKTDGFEVLLNIDHHISNQGYAKFNIVVPDAAATCEVLATLFLELDLLVDPTMAEALYLGVNTDTGRFKYSSTSENVFRICADLCKCGANIAHVSRALYGQFTFNRFQLLTRFLQSIQLNKAGNVGVGVLTFKDYEETETVRNQTEGFVEYVRSIKGVAVAVFIEKNENSYKSSLRSLDGGVRVDLVAAQFGGGGHKTAAGLSIDNYDAGRDFKVDLIAAIEKKLN